MKSLEIWSLKKTWKLGESFGELGEGDLRLDFMASIMYCIVQKVFGPVAHPKSARRIVFEEEEIRSVVLNFCLISSSILILTMSTNDFWKTNNHLYRYSSYTYTVLSCNRNSVVCEVYTFHTRI